MEKGHTQEQMGDISEETNSEYQGMLEIKNPITKEECL